MFPMWRHWPGGSQEETRRRPGRGSALSLSRILTTEGSFLYYPRNHVVYIILAFVVRCSTKQSTLTEYVCEDFSITATASCQLPESLASRSHYQLPTSTRTYRPQWYLQQPGDFFTTQQNFFHLLRRFGCFGVWLVWVSVLFPFITLQGNTEESPSSLSYRQAMRRYQHTPSENTLTWRLLVPACPSKSNSGPDPSSQIFPWRNQLTKPRETTAKFSKGSAKLISLIHTLCDYHSHDGPSFLS